MLQNGFAPRRSPLIIAGGGVLYPEASDALSKFAQATGIPVCETNAGKGSLPFDHPQNVGAIGVTGTPGANILAREADLVIGIGTRYSDFTTASKTAFQNPRSVSSTSTSANSTPTSTPALALTGDARITIEELQRAIGGYRVDARLRNERSPPSARIGKKKWIASTASAKIRRSRKAEVIGIVNDFTEAVGHHGLRRGQHARRLAQTLAHAQARRLPHGVWLFLHGLRNRRRTGRENGASRTAKCMCWWATART